MVGPDLSDEYLRTIIDTVPDVLFVQTAEGRMEMANRATTEVLGKTLPMILGQLHRDLSERKQDVAELEQQIAEALKFGEERIVERPVIHPVTGETRWYATRVVPLVPPGGGPPQALVVGTDITLIREAEESLKVAKQEVLTRLARAAEFRDDDTGKHTKRVGKLSCEIARLLGWSEESVELVRQAAPLHDIGKIGIPDSILLKPGPLTDAEFDRMKEHTRIGALILSGGSSDVISMAETIAMGHHEKWNGSGYPCGLREDENDPAARMVAVADIADALAHDRPYRRAWPHEEVIGELRRLRGWGLEPNCVDACLEIIATRSDWSQWAEA